LISTTVSEATSGLLVMTCAHEPEEKPIINIPHVEPGETGSAHRAARSRCVVLEVGVRAAIIHAIAQCRAAGRHGS
jgi:hypothetical protein